MIEEIKIRSWSAPVWHEDFGSAGRELSLLKEVCLLISNFDSLFRFNLHHIEEGYMEVSVSKNDKVFMEIVVTDSVLPMFGLFFQNGDEKYIDKPSCVLEYLT